MIQHCSQPPGYERKVRTVPLTRPLQIGHFRSDGAHSLHTTRCPQGMKTMLTSLSIHTLQVRSSWRRRNCSSMGRSAEKKTFMIPLHYYLHTNYCTSASPGGRIASLKLIFIYPFSRPVKFSWVFYELIRGSRCHCYAGCKCPQGRCVFCLHTWKILAWWCSFIWLGCKRKRN